MTVKAFRVHALTFGYQPETPVLRDLTCELPAGRITAVLGPNGAGKSTLLQLLLGYHHPQQGEILLFDRPLHAYDHHDLSHLVGWVPQREHVPFAFRVREFVLLGRSPHLGLLARPRAQDWQAVDAVLNTLGIEALAKRPLSSLSGGEHHMVLLARALVKGAQVLLLDEPTAHLDLGNRYRIWRILQRLAKRGHTVVLTTHTPAAAAHLAAHVLLLANGRLCFAGPAEAALTTERLRALYHVPLRVQRLGGEIVVLPPSGGEISSQWQGFIR